MRRALARLVRLCLRRLRGPQATVWEIYPGYMTRQQIDDLVHGRPFRDVPPSFTQPGVISIRHLDRLN